MSRVSRVIDRIQVTFDDETLVADAGLIVPATLMVRLGVETLVNQTVRLVGRVGGALPGRKILTLVAAILAGGSHIDHADKLRAGATEEVLPFRVMAPSTLGTFLRSFTFGHVRQLDAVIAETIRRAWSLGAGPGSDAMTIDVDSTICEVHGKQKHGAAYGYTKVLGYHPLLATRADTGEVLHARLRKGSSQRGHKRFVEELIARVQARRCHRPADGASRFGVLVLRADRHAQAAQSPLVDHHRHQCPGQVGDRVDRRGRMAGDHLPRGRRGPSRRDHLCDRVARQPAPAAPGGATHPPHRHRATQLWPDWRHHAFITNVALPTVEVDQFHRDHATVELAIRDLKEGAGLEHCPSGRFFANAAWLGCAVLAHNLIRWTACLGDVHPDEQLTVARTIRTRLLELPGRLVNRSRHWVLRLPARWPWATSFNIALDRIRSLPLLT